MSTPASAVQEASSSTPRVIALAPPHSSVEVWQLHRWLVSLAIGLGAVQAWSTRHAVDPDAISYMDMGDAFMRGDWSMALNAYWSPFYPWLVGLVRAVVSPGAYWEYAIIHLLNFGIYVGALFAFRFFLNELIRHQPLLKPRAGGHQMGLPPPQCLVLGYTLFVWASLVLIQLRLLGPDMLVAGFAYLLAGLLLRMHSGGAGWRAGLLFGLILGFGYLTKIAMLPMALVFLVTGLAASDSVSGGVRRMLVAAAVFVLVASMWLVPISLSRGRLTFGSAATLNYAWSGGTDNHHWRGGSGEGTPLHPTRQVPAPIPIFEFATPIGGTYPFWYDPSYWFEGLKPAVDVEGRSRIVLDNIVMYVTDFSLGGTLVVGLLLLSLMRPSAPLDVKSIWAFRGVLAPAAAALAMFTMVWLVPRMLGPWLVLFYMGAYGTRLLPVSVDSRRVMGSIVAIVVVAALIPVGVTSARAAVSIVREVSAGTDVNRNWQIAQTLQRMGLREGDRVAILRVQSMSGLTHSLWAHLARVRIVAEGDAKETAGHVDEQGVFKALESIGIKLVVADAVPAWSLPDSWQPIADSGYFAHFLERKP